MRHFFRISPRIIKPQNIHLGAGNYGSCRQRDHVQMDSTNSSKRTNISQIQSLSIIYGACQCLFLLSTSRALALLVTATTHLFMGQFHSQELQQFCQQLPQLISTMSLYHTQYATYIGIASFKAHSPSFFSPSSLWKLTFIFGRRVASSDWSNWSKWAASPWCTVSGEMDGRKWSEWCGATASGKKAVKLDAIGPKPCPWWPSAKQVECPSWLCWPVRSETKLLIADFKAMLLSNKAFYRQTKLLFFPTDTDPKRPRPRKIAELNIQSYTSDSGLNISFIPEYASECLLCTSWHETSESWLDFTDPYLAVSRDTSSHKYSSYFAPCF